MPFARSNQALDALDANALAAVYRRLLDADVTWRRTHLASCATGAAGVLAAGEVRRLMVDRYARTFYTPLHTAWDGLAQKTARGVGMCWPARRTPESALDAPHNASLPQPCAAVAAPAEQRGPQLVGASVAFVPRALTELAALAYLGISEGASVIVGATAGIAFGLLLAAPIGARLSDEHLGWVLEVLAVLRRARELLARQGEHKAQPHQAALLVLAAALLAQLAQHVEPGMAQGMLQHVATFLTPLPPVRVAPKPAPARKGGRHLLSVIDEEGEMPSALAEQPLDAALQHWMAAIDAPLAQQDEAIRALEEMRWALARTPQPTSAAGATRRAGGVRAGLRSTAAPSRPPLPRTRSAPVHIPQLPTQAGPSAPSKSL